MQRAKQCVLQKSQGKTKAGVSTTVHGLTVELASRRVSAADATEAATQQPGLEFHRLRDNSGPATTKAHQSVFVVSSAMLCDAWS